MGLILNSISFNWDEGNIKKNLIKHNVSIQESEEIFFEDPLMTYQDLKHSTHIEKRYVALGKTRDNRMLFCVFTIRQNKIRIISIRDMKKQERRSYEKFEKDT